MLAHNLNRDVPEARLFEQGAVFSGSAETVVELHSLSLGLTGELPAARLHGAKDAGIFELKGVVESLLSLFAVSPEALSASAASRLTFSSDAPAWIEPGRGATALLDGKVIAVFGELAATEREARKLRQPVYLAEVTPRRCTSCRCGGPRRGSCRGSRRWSGTSRLRSPTPWSGGRLPKRLRRWRFRN